MRASSRARWHVAADAIDLLRREPGITRAELAQRLGIGSGSATEVVARLRESRLVSEVPAPVSGRGRPTTVLTAHASGPLVVAADLRHGDWRCAVAGLDGRLATVARGRHGSREPAAVIAALRGAVEAVARSHPGRVRAVSVAAAGTVRDGGLVQAAGLRWGPVDLGELALDGAALLLLGNDATLAGVAEARTGAAAATRSALHLMVEVGIGGALIVDGRPLPGATGAAGEFGHLPLGDPALRCPCGARGCWDLEVDGRALARRLGAPPPTDPRGYARAVLAATDAASRQAVTGVVTALAGGIAGLVNAHDPQVVTLGGLAGPLRAAAPAAFDAAYVDGLMTFRKDEPPPVLTALHGADGALHGAAAVGLDLISTPAALAAWAMEEEHS
ncbi:ROK family transcriptional regulator [Pseudonocardia sp. GCM10023141]|uniref:ROK family transcriptional regulator n=1 Tax=Pseudonocardia sp. GCM10023141 TaxID=3252653 RepID=UPI0036214AF2